MAYIFSKIEKKWSKIWSENGLYEPKIKKPSAKRKPFYNLMMFPYPSAEGLHVGNMYAFTGSDIYGRFKRMQGYDVFEPIGLDGFGIHSENYALKIGIHPAKQAKISEKNFYRQLEAIGNSFAWKEKLETYDPDYYKWTQWIFAQFFKKGLAYRKKQAVNWCPSCKTVLADEQVIAGKCERCGTDVIKKELEQWFFKITDYAEELLNDLENLDWSEKVKIAQKNWIGRSDGAEIEFQIKNSEHKIKVFTTRPDTLFGATYLVLAPEHYLIKNLEFKIENWKEAEKYIEKAKAKSENERIAEGNEKTGIILKGIKAFNPVNNEELPVWIADYVLSSYGTGAIMAVPAHDQRDFDFAKKYGLPIKEVVRPADNASSGSINLSKIEKAYEAKGVLINSQNFNGKNAEEAKWEIAKFAGGKKKTNYRLRDWLISRQRYWGPPIPMIYCEKCAAEGKGERSDMPGWYTVPEKNLPVELPFLKDFKPMGTGASPLSSVKSFYETTCPVCHSKARRETDVSDTFLDSAWYFFRYLDVKNKKKVFDKTVIKKWLPVDMYIGGAEHAVLHLLYTRFVTKVFHDMKLIDFSEPFKKFRAHGLLIKEGAKMSKSKGNVVNPDEYIKKFGADALRMYLMFLAPFEQGGDFRDSGILGITRFLERTRKLGENIIKSDKKAKNQNLEKYLNQTVKKITEDIESLHYNTAISSLMILLSRLEDAEYLSRDYFEKFLKLLAPFAPFLTEELWSKFGNKNSIHLEKWPTYNAKLIKEETFKLIIQINGKTKATIEAEKGMSKEKAEAIATADPKIKSNLQRFKTEKIIYVPDRLINFVIKEQ
ncbi:MAG: leucine--tRNA ligase [Patescibacteria group bacterium]|nr:leucine--tRNA ligase [Patescibacteria group bacterium]